MNARIPQSLLRDIKRHGYEVVGDGRIYVPKARMFIGGVFVIEAVTWMIQIATFKRTGRRVFLMVPIHHHFELKTWSETKIMVRFWIVGAILCALGFVLYYRYFLRFNL